MSKSMVRCYRNEVNAPLKGESATENGTWNGDVIFSLAILRGGFTYGRC